MYEIILGRKDSDRKKYGTKGAILIGKHYVKMGQRTALSNEILMDVTTSHAVLVVGKRGSGKSYTLGVMAEGMANLPAEIAQNLAVVILDTMGIYWTMKYPNDKEPALLKEWNQEPKALVTQIYTPEGHYKDFKEKSKNVFIYKKKI